MIDDYAHHPVEIKAVLDAARDTANGRVIAVMQPHRYSRLHELHDEFQSCFNEADQVYVTPVYSAGEQPIDGVDAGTLVSGLKSRGHRAVSLVADEAELADTLICEMQAGDLVIFMGAGDITRWAARLPQALAERRRQTVSG